MRPALAARQRIVLTLTATVAFGVAGGLLFGPVWGIVGAAVGPFIAAAIVMACWVITAPDADKLLKAGEPQRALQVLNGEMANIRALAGQFPRAFRDVLAHKLLARSDALRMLGRYPQALGDAGEAVEILRGYAIAGRERYVSNLAYGRYRQAELLSGMSRHGEALGAACDAGRLYRELAVSDPAYLTSLAESLELQADALGHLDRPEEASTAAAEATLIRSDKVPGAPSGA
jgi:hypothetical protein